MHPNCSTYKQKLEELKNLYNQFQEELEVFKSSRDSGNIWETRKKIEEVVEYFEEEVFFKAEPFTKEELNKLRYEEDNNSDIVLDENITWEEVERFSMTPDVKADLTKIPQEFKNKIKEWEGSLTDYSLEFNYPNLKTVKGSLYALVVENFETDSLEAVGWLLWVGSAKTFKVPNLKEVEKIWVSALNLQNKNVDVPKEIRKKIIWKD